MSYAINCVIDFKPNARVLLAYAQWGDAASEALKGALRELCPRLTSIDFITHRGSRHVEAFKVVDARPRLLGINLNATSRGQSLEGLDLGVTDAMIVDKTASTTVVDGVLTQFVGRGVRPQKLPASHRWDAPTPSFPNKKVIYITRAT